MYRELYKRSKELIFADSMLIINVQGALVIRFFHNTLLFYNDSELIKRSSFISIHQLHAMLLCLHNRSSRAKLLKTEEADRTFSVTENKTNSITDIFFLKYYLDLGLLRLSYSWEFFPDYF